jgi:hypothetical protein
MKVEELIIDFIDPNAQRLCFDLFLPIYKRPDAHCFSNYDNGRFEMSFRLQEWKKKMSSLYYENIFLAMTFESAKRYYSFVQDFRFQSLDYLSLLSSLFLYQRRYGWEVCYVVQHLLYSHIESHLSFGLKSVPKQSFFSSYIDVVEHFEVCQFVVAPVLKTFVRQQVEIMRSLPIMACSGTVVCMFCDKRTKVYVHHMIVGRTGFICLPCSKKKMPNVLNTSVAKNGDFVFDVVSAESECSKCHRTLSRGRVKRGNALCSICTAEISWEEGLVCSVHGKHVKGSFPCPCPMSNFKCNVDPDKVVYCSPQSYDPCVPDYQIDVSVDFFHYLPYRMNDISLIILRTMQFKSFCSLFHYEPSQDDQSKFAYASIRCQVEYLNSKIAMGLVQTSELEFLTPTVQKRVLHELLAFHLNGVDLRGLNCLLAEGSDCEIPNDWEKNYLFEQYSSKLVKCEIIQFMLVLSQEYLIDLDKLKNFVLTYLSVTGILKIRVVQIFPVTMNLQYMCESIRFSKFQNRLVFRDVGYYKFYFGQFFNVEELGVGIERYLLITKRVQE